MDPIHSLSLGFGQIGVLPPWDDTHAAVHLGVCVLGLLSRSEQGCIARRVIAREGGDSFGRPSLVRLIIILTGIIHLRSPPDHVLLHLYPLPAALPAKGVFERLVRQQAGVVLAGLHLFRRILQKPHRELLPLHHDAVRVRHRTRHLLPELIELRRLNHARVPEPPPIRGDASRGPRDFGIARSVAHHELSAHDLPLLVPYGLSVVVHL
mmetsp:Transcript_43748/g.93012  ORF Transcript_43748/g.93012 Transcript_43748/m.93012 type:complete len:209 (+) Transcript_43748:1153-1779(+)